MKLTFNSEWLTVYCGLGVPPAPHTHTQTSSCTPALHSASWMEPLPDLCARPGPVRGHR